MSLACGVPDNTPVTVLNDAQPGRFCTLNVSGSLFGSDAVGTNEYAVPAMTDDDGVPPIVGVALGAFTVIENSGSVSLRLPSLTLIEILV